MKRIMQKRFMPFLAALLMVFTTVFGFDFGVGKVLAASLYTVTFEGTGTHTVQVEGSNLLIDGQIVELRNSSNTKIGNAAMSGENTAAITVEGTTEGELNYGGNSFTLYNTSGHVAYTFGTKISSNTVFKVEDYANPSSGGSGATNATADITINGVSGSTIVDACVYENWQTRNAEDKVIWNYADSFRCVNISLDGGQRIGPHDYDSSANNFTQSNYAYNYSGGNVTINVMTNWAYRVEGLTVNGTEYNIPINYDDKTDWLNHFAFEYRNQDLSFSISVPKSDDYTINIKARPISWTECYIGNFLWSSSELQKNSDMYIGHSSLELINVTYPDTPAILGGNSYDEATIRSESDVRPKDNKTAKYVTYGVDNTTGIGEMVIPVGSKVTMRVAPQYGYQVTEFKVNGKAIAADQVGTGSDVAVFTFTITPANFHLSATVVPVADAVNPAATSIDAGSITLGGTESSMSVGSARLDVKDTEVSDAEKASFAAATSGYEVADYLDISLYNTVYKGTTTASWDTEVTDLSNEATIALTTKTDLGTENVAVAHEKHDGTVEIIPATYNRQNQSLEFKTKGFSKYAIVKGSGSGNLISVDAAAGTAMVNDLVAGTASEVPLCVVVEGSTWRMYNPNTGEHFYTKSDAERDYLKSVGWNFEENASFATIAANEDGAKPVYRVYNPNDGLHHYTMNHEEALMLKDIGWNYEGISFYAFENSSDKGSDEYRLYNPNDGQHHWTVDANERDFLKSIGWNDEGVAWKVK